MSHPALTLLIPAAGASSRMRGADKLLTPIDGEALLRRSARRALAAHPDVVVTLRPEDLARRAVLADLPLVLLPVAEAREGLAASLRAGARVAAGGGLLVLPADMPDLTTEDLAAVIAFWRSAPRALIRATAEDGTPGHPVLFPPDLLADFARLAGDEGARSLLQAHRARLGLLALPGQHALTDLDTPEAWAEWRARQSPRPDAE